VKGGCRKKRERQMTEDGDEGQIDVERKENSRLLRMKMKLREGR